MLWGINSTTLQPKEWKSKMEEQNIDISKIEIRSEEVQEILGKPPRWIIRAGISVIFAVILALLVGSWFFKYPDVIVSQVVLTTENPPASLKAMRSGKITELFYKEKTNIQLGSVIAIIENTANYQDVFFLKNVLDTAKDYHSLNLNQPLKTLNLGEIQSAYANFQRLYKSYESFQKLDYHQEKIKAVKQQISDYKLYYNRLWKQHNLQEKELDIAQKQYNRDKKLYQKRIYAELDFEKAEKTYLQQKISFENARTTLASTQMQINQLHQQILDLQLQETQEKERQEIALQEGFDNLKQQLKQWEQAYLLASPISGKITFTQVWSKHQNVQVGQTVATIIPKKATNIIGKLTIPAMGIGKVKQGQRVNIKLDNFPYMEFGLMRGTVNNISLVPTVTEEGVFYTADIHLPDTLISNYGRKLKFNQEMSGTAEIITDDIRLLERFLNPIKALIKENVE